MQERKRYTREEKRQYVVSWHDCVRHVSSAGNDMTSNFPLVANGRSTGVMNQG